MNLLHTLGKLLGNDVRGIANTYHGLNPFDKQGWQSPPLPPPTNHALPVKPIAPPAVLNSPIQGSNPGLQLGGSNLAIPAMPAYLRRPGFGQIPGSPVTYRWDFSNPAYDLPINGFSNDTRVTGWHASDSTVNALKLNPQYYRDEYPQLPLVPRIQ